MDVVVTVKTTTMALQDGSMVKDVVIAGDTATIILPDCSMV